MASTSTNKQPLLVDHVLHKVLNLNDATNFTSNGFEVSPTNSAALILDSTQADGAIIEDLYLISKSAIPYTVELFISTANDYLRPNQGEFIGYATSATTKGAVTHIGLPRVLTPVPVVGSDPQNNALYIPRGAALWAAVESNSALTDAPLIGAQGGWY